MVHLFGYLKRKNYLSKLRYIAVQGQRQSKDNRGKHNNEMATNKQVFRINWNTIIIILDMNNTSDPSSQIFNYENDNYYKVIHKWQFWISFIESWSLFTSIKDPLGVTVVNSHGVTVVCLQLRFPASAFLCPFREYFLLEITWLRRGTFKTKRLTISKLLK